MTGPTLAELTEKLARVSDTYAANCDIARDDDWYALKLSEEVGELVAEHLRGSGRGRRKGMTHAEISEALADEAADVLAMTLLFARHNGIDLVAALERKWFSYLEATPKLETP